METVQALLESIVSTADRCAVVERLRGRGKPVYGTDPRFPGRVVRIDPDGARTPGRFIHRRFVPADEA